MRDFRNICLIDTPGLIEQAFVSLGCTVHRFIHVPELFFDLPGALAEIGFSPDLVIQTESLGQRRILLGLEEMDCPVLFWALDPHLNARWHSAYANLFDLTCSTQQREIPLLKSKGATDVRSLPVFGLDLPWRDGSKRQNDLAFVGRITEQRPERKWMVEFLESRKADRRFRISGGMPYPEMLDLYQDSRIIPNESILGEINFRLFEGASCGCLVLDQALGDEQAELFNPGREFDTYAEVAELDEKLAMYLGNERLVHAIGRAAWERVQAEHLPIHRAERLLEYARSASRNRAEGKGGAKWMALTLAAMWESGLAPLTSEEILSRLTSLEQDAEIAAAMLMVQTVAGKKRVLSDNINTLLGGKKYQDSLDVNLYGSLASLRIGNWDGAKAFWYRHMQSVGDTRSAPPQSGKQLLTLWAKGLKRQGRVVRGGFSFDPARHLPGSAVECLLAALHEEPEDLPVLRLLDGMLRSVPGLDLLRVGFLSILTLHDRADWHLAFEIALANLRSYRLGSGLEELRLARSLAMEQGQERAFAMALSARDVSGQIARRLG